VRKRGEKTLDKVCPVLYCLQEIPLQNNRCFISDQTQMRYVKAAYMPRRVEMKKNLSTLSLVSINFSLDTALLSVLLQERQPLQNQHRCRRSQRLKPQYGGVFKRILPFSPKNFGYPPEMAPTNDWAVRHLPSRLS